MSTSNNRFVRSEEGSNCSNRQSRLQQLGWERKKERKKKKCPRKSSDMPNRKRTEENKSLTVLCTWPLNTVPSETCQLFFWGLICSTHTRWLYYSLWDNHFGPISQRNWGLRIQTPWQACQNPAQDKQTGTHRDTQTFVSFMMQTEAEITGSCGSVWKHAPQRWGYADRWGGRQECSHTKKNPLSPI